METLGQDLETMRRVPLAPAHVDAICAIGGEKFYPAGAIVMDIGERLDRFVYILEGEVEIALPLHAPLGTVVIAAERCTLCSACARICPFQALALPEGTGQLAFTEARCTQCGRCVRAGGKWDAAHGSAFLCPGERMGIVRSLNDAKN
jgi:ferredoxin